MALTADFYSVQQTTYNALVAGTSTVENPAGMWGGSMHCFMSAYDLAGTFPKSKTLGICTVPAGVIVVSVGWVISASLSTAVIGLGSSASTAKYRVAAVFTTVGQWFDYRIPTAAGGLTALTASELVVAANDATADSPTSGVVEFRVLVLRPR